MWFAIKLFFAGLWPLIFHWGTGVALIVICILLEVFAGWLQANIPFFGNFIMRIRRDLLWVAVGIALFLIGGWFTARDMANRCEAQSQVIDRHVKDVVSGVEKPSEQSKPDPWDNPKN